jgi:hypothetical protein
LSFTTRRPATEKSRLAVAPCGGALHHRATIIFQLKQGKLPGLGGLPGLKLPATEFANLLPAIGVTADQDGIGLRHGRASRGIGPVWDGVLQAVQEIRRALGVRCGGENRPLIVLQHLDPRPDTVISKGYAAKLGKSRTRVHSQRFCKFAETLFRNNLVSNEPMENCEKVIHGKNRRTAWTMAVF